MIKTQKGKKNRCGSTETASGRPCNYTNPCPYHAEGGSSKRTARRSRGGSLRAQQAVRQEKLLQGVAEGKTVNKAARDAGYSEKTVAGKVYQIMDTPAMQRRIERTIALAQLQTDEIIGRQVGMMRMDIADLFPDDEFLQKAQKRGISQNIKKVKRERIIVGYDGPEKDQPIYKMEIAEVEIYDSLDSSKSLSRIYGQNQLPAPNQKALRDFQAAVDRICQAARDTGIDSPEEELRAKVEKLLWPRYQKLLKGRVAQPA